MVMMTFRQKLLSLFYPLLMKITSRANRKNALVQRSAPEPVVSFYVNQAETGNGKPVHFDAFRGKYVLLVNTASDCGYTAQYDGLGKLFDAYRDKLVILAFPSNDFKEQERGGDEEIAKFCRVNYGVQFPVMKKSVVLKKPGQHSVYAWLTDQQKNGWNNRVPVWNFSKYLVDPNGRLIAVFGPSADPMGPEIKSLLT